MSPARSARTAAIRLAGAAALLLAAGALLLPAIYRWPSGALIGLLLLVAGALEFAAGAALGSGAAGRRTMLAGGVSLLAGTLFLLNVFVHFLTATYIVAASLLVRGGLLLLLSRRSGEPAAQSVRMTALADLFLGLVLLVGLPVSALVLLLFGPTTELVASLALILAVSFLVTGLYLLALADRRDR